MRFYPVNSITCRFSAAALLLLLWVISAAAQQTIQFTKPVDQDPSSKANAFMATPSHRTSADAFNAPTSLLGDRNSAVNFDVLPGSPQPNPAAVANAAQWQKFLENKKNWALMTPEEILGIPTPEKILGIPDPRDDSKMSAGERFLLRRDQQDFAGATNGLRRPDSAFWRGDAGGDSLRPGDLGYRPPQPFDAALPGTAKNLSPLQEVNASSLASMNQKRDSTWGSPFGSPEPSPKSTAEQLADRERFRALMEPPVPEKAPEAARFNYQPGAATFATLRSASTENPAGHSFTPLQSDIAKPTGIAPLSGVTGPRPTEKKPTSLVQPPPWLQDSSPAFKPVQRQF
jgi:hypothetical protein